MCNWNRTTFHPFLLTSIMGLFIASCQNFVNPAPTVEKPSGPIQLPPEWTATAMGNQELFSTENYSHTQVANSKYSYPSSTPTPPYLKDITPTAYPSPWVMPTSRSRLPSFTEPISASGPETMEYQRVFPCGTREVFARWEYSNMREGLIIRREWFHNGELWLVREEPWDFQKYGDSGEVKDISIYDYDNGLEPGSYSLDLYIDGVLAETSLSFRVLGWVVDPLPSPNGKHTAIVKRPGTLIIQDEDGKQRVLLETDEIAGMAWFPDGKHLVYTNVDRSQQFNPPMAIGLRFELWVVNIKNKERYRLSTAEERLWKPMISPNGRYIAAVVGTGWADACLYDKGLVFLSLDREFHRIAKYEAEDFAGIITGHPDGTWSIYPEDGDWVNDTGYWAKLREHCVPAFEDGVYIFNLSTLTATRISDTEN
jgi:hypothetical protein